MSAFGDVCGSRGVGGFAEQHGDPHHVLRLSLRLRSTAATLLQAGVAQYNMMVTDHHGEQSLATD